MDSKPYSEPPIPVFVLYPLMWEEYRVYPMALLSKILEYRIIKVVIELRQPRHTGPVSSTGQAPAGIRNMWDHFQNLDSGFHRNDRMVSG
jgi:hypothetical protein